MNLYLKFKNLYWFNEWSEFLELKWMLGLYSKQKRNLPFKNPSDAGDSPLLQSPFDSLANVSFNKPTEQASGTSKW